MHMTGLWSGSNQLKNNGGNWMRMIHRDDRSAVETGVRRQLDARRPFDVEYCVIRTDGPIR